MLNTREICYANKYYVNVKIFPIISPCDKNGQPNMPNIINVSQVKIGV